MPIDRFSLDEFTSALPKGSRHLGLIEGEHCFVYPVIPPGKSEAQVEIFIRSSVGRDNLAADTGKDSIRAYLVDAVDRKPVAAKLQRWTARTSGWRTNLLTLLRQLWKMGALLGACPQCNKGQLRIHISKTEHNPNRPFLSCYNGGAKGCGYFKWLDEVLK